jgi:cytochrome o ubiquinol oxidase subunit 2
MSTDHYNSGCRLWYSYIRMRIRGHLIATGLLLAATIGFCVVYFSHHDVAVLRPAGEVAMRQREVLYLALGLSCLVVLPVFALTFFIIWKYRATNTTAAYTPEWDRNTKLELLWWGIPCAIIAVLAVVTWQTSHSLDPAKPLASQQKAETIQVIALQWKWLFLYPDRQVASVNQVIMPTGRPVKFEITADAPMNSFWIPRLGGQIYAMPGMTTYLNLIANHSGDYAGSSANISGAGFAAMHFTARSLDSTDYTQWLLHAKTAPSSLTLAEYRALSVPAVFSGTRDYAAYDRGLYDSVMQKYMGVH